MVDASLISKKESFWDRDINKDARKSFNEFCQKVNFSTTIATNKMVIYTPKNEFVGEFLVVGTEKQKILKIPVPELKNISDKTYVAVVVFEKDIPNEIFAFKAADLKLGKNKRLYKNFPDENMYGIKIKKYRSKYFAKQRIGVVLYEHINI